MPAGTGSEACAPPTVSTLVGLRLKSLGARVGANQLSLQSAARNSCRSSGSAADAAGECGAGGFFSRAAAETQSRR